MQQRFTLTVLFFALTCMITGCKKDTSTNNSTPSGSYFKGTIDGTAVEITKTLGDETMSYYSGPDYIYNGGGGFFNPTEVAAIDIYHHYNLKPDMYGLDSLFAVAASLPYSSGGNNPTNGVYIRWVDANGHTWASNNAPATQQGSNFAIATSSSINAYKVITYTGTFNCILYDSLGHSKVLTNGSYSSVALLE